MRHGNTLQKQKILLRLLLLSALTLTGCTPEEKTMLLPMAQTSEEESESADPARDFTVKKIFTYTYETSELLLKSAYLEGCGENQIRINAVDGKREDGLFVCRQVDYRYGFYDILGEFFLSRDDWAGPDQDTADSEPYIETLLPSPDGRQLLAYVRPGDTCSVWLYALGSREPWLLYEGSPEPNGGPLTGAFSPCGRWVTFDAKGSATGNQYMVPVYDCGKTEFAGREEYLALTGDSKAKSPSGLLCPPDKTLYSPSDWRSERPWAATLCDISEAPGLLSFFREEDKALLSFELHWDELSETPAGQSAADENPHAVHNISSYLFNYDGISYLQYKVDNSNMRFFYMGNLFRLIQVDMEPSGLPAEEIFVFPNLVWDFLPLDTGDILVMLVQETGSGGPGESAYGGEWPQNESARSATAKYMSDGAAGPLAIRSYWDIRSADLYLYPAEGERRLLYKNVQNLLGMEYDAETRRILLETGEEGSLAHRKCIILEL